jgi:hypothetical protein
LGTKPQGNRVSAGLGFSMKTNKTLTKEAIC